MMKRLLAAICFDDGQDIDSLLFNIAAHQTTKGNKVLGVLQVRGDTSGECHCSDMDLKAIGSEKIFRISQPLGQGSAGCRLHPGALAECSAYLQQRIEEGCNLLILNRFGKGESEGRGFRDLITYALGASIPVLIAVRPSYQKSFQIFSGDLGVELPFDENSIETWFSDHERAYAA